MSVSHTAPPARAPGPGAGPATGAANGSPNSRYVWCAPRAAGSGTRTNAERMCGRCGCRGRAAGAEPERARVHRTALVSGAPEQVYAVLTALAAAHGVDELIVNTLTADPADRRRSYELLAETFELPADRREAAVTA
ncbi:hypothetical protein [Streptomyces virginiae]|uniref:hypothetical protein n=1 Tax=Streptomyces virginiae TaxID=1961 RepID=UPI00342F6AA1